MSEATQLLVVRQSGRRQDAAHRIQIIAAVSAIVSAFRNGSDLFTVVKKKRRAARKYKDPQQEWEESQISSALSAGEKQIHLRFERDQRELGDFVRIGDDVARDRLFHIAALLQTEIIDTLSLASGNKFGVVNLRLLHEASITNRKDAIRALDDLKQRIYTRMFMARQLEKAAEETRVQQSRAPAQIMPRYSYDSIRPRTNGYTPSIATSAAIMDPRIPRKESPEYPQTSDRTKLPVDIRSVYTQPVVDSNSDAAPADSRTNYRTSMIREIQHVISSYKEFNFDNGTNSHSSHPQDNEHPARRDTLVTANDRALFDEYRRGSGRKFHQSSNHEAIGLGIASGTSVLPVSEDMHGFEKEHPAYNQRYDTPDPRCREQAQRPPHRWSGGSVSSSAVSNSASLHRSSSNSSQETHTEVPPPPPPKNEDPPPPPPKSTRRALTISVPDNAIDPQDDGNHSNSGSSYSPYAAAIDRYNTPSPIKELAPLRTRSSASAVNSSRYNAEAKAPPVNVDHPRFSAPSVTPSRHDTEVKAPSPVNVDHTRSSAPSVTPSGNNTEAKAPAPVNVDPYMPTQMPWPGDSTATSRAASPVMDHPAQQPHNPPIREEEEVEEVKRENFNTEEPAYDIHNLLIPRSKTKAYYSRPSIYSESIYSDTNEEKPPMPTNPSAFAAATSSHFASFKSTIMGLRHSPSLASTESGSSFSIGVLPGRLRRSNIIRTSSLSGSIRPSNSSNMLDGRPNKDNNYWGFCKGAWAVREEANKGLHPRTVPCGYYTTRQIFACKYCAFAGDVQRSPHPIKRGKNIELIDPRVRTSKSGIRYRWIFLAKSHIKKKVVDPVMDCWTEDNVGCVFCCVEGAASEVYSGIDTLMEHITREHVADMSERTRQKTKCILGRLAGEDEDWDINFPIFGDME
ncbi:Herpes-BLLF1 domain-containing protein [Pyrenophora tritici-repentis]|nr:Herpes-BLLF1 domain-containing protein [Pyrenophora tritici-repentis]